MSIRVSVEMGEGGVKLSAGVGNFWRKTKTKMTLCGVVEEGGGGRRGGTLPLAVVLRPGFMRGVPGSNCGKA